MIAGTKSMISKRKWLIVKSQLIFKLGEMNCKLTWRDSIESRTISGISNKLMKILMVNKAPKKKLKLSSDKSSSLSGHMTKKVKICRSIRTQNLTCIQKHTFSLTLFISSLLKLENSNLESIHQPKSLKISKI